MNRRKLEQFLYIKIQINMNILIENGLILTMTAAKDSANIIFKGSIVIEGNNIKMVTDDHSKIEDFKHAHKTDITVIDASGKIVMPGLINAHTHVAMALLRSISDDVPLMEWLNQHIWPIEGKMTSSDILIGAKLGILEMMLGGTTTFVDMYPYEEAVAEAAEYAGIRAVVSPCVMDFRMPHFEEDWKAVNKRFSDSSLVKIAVGPHAIYTCSDENMKRAVSLSRESGSIIHIHHSETADEDHIVREKYGINPTEYLLKAGVLERPTLAAHCVYMSDSDIEIFAKKSVSVAYNPQSNMKLSSGIAPISRMLSRGVNVAIGTDGAASNNDLDMWEELRTASLLQKVATKDPCVLPAYQVLRMATVNGARAIGMEGKLGVIANGALADVIMIDINKPHMFPHTNLISELVYSCKASDVDTVIINGKIVVEDGKCISMNSDTICNEAQNHLELLW